MRCTRATLFDSFVTDLPDRVFPVYSSFPHQWN